MYMIEISDSKVDKLSNHIEQSLRHLGKAMQCVDEWMGDGYGERGNYGSRGGSRYGSGSYGSRGNYGSRYDEMMGYRDEEDWDEDESMGERRGRRRRDSRGRYM